MRNYEHCIECEERTGRAGASDDSLYHGYSGPFCEDCFDAWPDNQVSQIIILRQELKQAQARMAEPVGEITTYPHVGVKFYENTDFGTALTAGTELYTHPPKAQAVTGGWTPSSEGPTGWEFRFVEALKLLCGGSEPSDRLVKEWINHESEDLQAWVASETSLHWSMGITTIEAAMSLADEPDEGGDHFGERPQPPQEGE